MEHNKHKRNMHKNVNETQSTLVSIIVTVASIVLIALIIFLSPLGALLQEHVVEPLISVFGNDGKDNAIVEALKTQDEQSGSTTSTAFATSEPIRKSVLTVQETPFYILQMGTYFDREAAEEHALQIHAMGAGGAVLLDGPVYRVLAAAYQDEDSLQQVQAQVRADGFEATPYITEQNAVKITLEGGEEAVFNAKSAIAFLSSVPNDLSALCIQYDLKEIDEKEINDKLAAILQQAMTFLDTFVKADGNSMEPILSVIEKYAGSISTFLSERDTISEDDLSADLRYLQIEIIIDYIRFFDQK